MDIRKLTAGIMALAMAAAASGCGAKPAEPEQTPTEPETEAVTEEITEEPTEEPTEPEPPHPVEASDPNAITFDDGNFSFASPKTTDDDSAQGTLEVVEVEGNPMLRFTDDGNNLDKGTVQKIQIDAAMLLTPEDLAKVKSVEMDIYADATGSKLDTEEATGVNAPGWIGGGGGANVSGDNWYQFGEWSGGEYNFPMSGPVHAEFKFLLYKGGKHWDETMTEAALLIMRWGAQNDGNFYIDNIVFYDEEGNSLPITLSEGSSSGQAEVAPEILDDVAGVDGLAEEVNEDVQGMVDSVNSALDNIDAAGSEDGE